MTGVAVRAQVAASYEVYGRACRGHGIGPRLCAVVNPRGGNNFTGSLRNEYAYGFRAAQALTVVGFELFTQTFSLSIPTTMRTALYRQVSPSQVEPSLVSVARGTMTVLPRLQFYTTYLDTPVAIAAGEAFWVAGLDATLIRAAGITTGQSPQLPTYWRAPAGSPTARWAVTGIVNYPSVKVLCLGGGAMGAPPILTHTGVPKLGATFAVEVRQAIPGQIANLLFGVSDQRWGTLRLPFDLSRIGAPGCGVFAAGDLIIGIGRTDGRGFASFSIGVPNHPVLAGFRFFNQFYVIDPANNAMGIAVSNAGVGVAGR